MVSEEEFLKMFNTYVNSLSGKPKERALQRFGDTVTKKLQLDAYAAGFKAPYKGEFVGTLLTWIDKTIAQGTSPGASCSYSYIFPIIQASGFGKTRSLLELSRAGVFVFYINCREEGRCGYPLRSREADGFHIRGDEQGLGFIRAVLEQLREFLEPRQQQQQQQLHRRGGSAVASEWTDGQVMLEQDQVSSVGSRWRTRWETDPTAAVDDVKASFHALCSSGFLREGSLKVLFVFDEASALFRDASALTAGYFLKRSFKHVPGLMAVLVDTRADISVVAAQASHDPIPIQPYHELYTVCALDWSKYTDSELPLEDLYALGRPLWGGLVPASELLDIAVHKLLGGVTPNQVRRARDGKVSLHQAAAVLSACLCLAVDPRSSLAVALAGDYMNPVLDISKDRSSVTIMDPWDPVLSAAAKDIFRSGKFRRRALRHIVKASQDHLIDEDGNGELVCRYVLLRAMIRAERASGTVTVKRFLEALLGRKRVKSKDLGVLEDYTLNFDSFTPVTFPPREVHLKAGYCLRKALLCVTGQSRFGGVIPVMGPGNTAVSMIGLQFRSYKNPCKFIFEGGVYMNPVRAGFGEFKNFVTVLLQVHPRRKPDSSVRVISRKQGVGKNTIDSRQTAYVADGLESLDCVRHEEEKELLRHVITCRGTKQTRYYHLQCIREGKRGSKRKRS